MAIVSYTSVSSQARVAFTWAMLLRSLRRQCNVLEERGALLGRGDDEWQCFDDVEKMAVRQHLGLEV